MARSPALTVEDIPQLVDAIAEGVVRALERRGIVTSGKSSLGMENDRCDSQEREFMGPINIAPAGDSSSLDEEAARRLSRFRRRQRRRSTSAPSSSRSPGDR
jgi:hypothetical protein